MKPALIAVALCLLASLCLCQGSEEKTTQTESVPSPTEEEQAKLDLVNTRISRIKQVISMKIQALNEGNCKAFVQLMKDDGMSIDPSAGAIIGKSNIYNSCVSFLSMFSKFHLAIKTLRIMFQEPPQALLEWEYVGVTGKDCLFHLDGMTHYDFDNYDSPSIRISRETDFYSLSDMKRGLHCPVERLPAGENKNEIKSPEQSKLINDGSEEATGTVNLGKDIH